MTEQTRETPCDRALAAQQRTIMGLEARVAELEAIAKRAVQMDRDLVPMIDPNEGNGKIIRLALANHGRDARVALKEPPK
jgi:hypothetical protein